MLIHHFGGLVPSLGSLQAVRYRHILALPQNHTKLNFPETIRIPLEFEIVIALSIALQNCVAKLHFIIESNLTLLGSAGGRFAPTFTYSRIHAHVCIQTCWFFLLFLTFSVEEVAKSFTQKKFTVFPEIQKVGPIWQNFIREYPYEPQKTSKKVTFSDHYFGWFQVSESCKTLCLASILVRYKVPTQFWSLPAINTFFMGWGQICPPPPSLLGTKKPRS